MDCFFRNDYPVTCPPPFPERFPKHRELYPRPYPPSLGPRNPRNWW